MNATNLSVKPNVNTPAATRRARIAWTQRIRHLVQFGFAAFILYSRVLHVTAADEATTASIDALCAFGGLETLWKFASIGGSIFSLYRS